ncbi:MAG: DNA-processing protein DprA [Desulfovibrionaceae bacterium]|nr:DNA-processing protein DprA [Desulfovibrionaceae bacterium]
MLKKGQGVDNAPPSCAATSFADLSDSQKKEFWASLALKHTQGLGLRRARLLLERHGSAYAAIQTPDQWKQLRVNPAAIEYFKTEQWREKAGEEWSAAKMPNLRILLWTNPYYPAQLREIPDPPMFLYFRGNIELLSSPAIAVVGARQASPEALAAGHRIAHELSRAGITVISGLARGVDSEAHKAALPQPGSTIAVLGCGLDIYYPGENRHLQDAIADTGLIISEYPPGTKPEAHQFPIRNRLISGISLGVLVVEAAGRSGSLITARLALEYGREVFAMPGKFAASKAQGSHELIRSGATPVLDPDDLLLELLPRLKTYTAFMPNTEIYPENTRQEATGHTPAASTPQPRPDAEPDNLSQAASEENNSDFRKSSSPSVKRSDYPVDAAPGQDASSRIIELLEVNGPLHADSICSLLRLPVSKVSAELMLLELSGQIKRYPGMIYSL